MPTIRYLVAALLPVAFALPVAAHEGESHETTDEGSSLVDTMREMHEGHEHAHDFEAIDHLSASEMAEVMDEMIEIGLAVPPMDAHRGREVFVEKGCVVCHEVNGVGGQIGPSLNASDMPVPMNAFEFAARMWRGADAMIQMQQSLFGEQIELTGQDLGDLVAFAHDAGEQEELDANQIPEEYWQLIP